MQSLTAMHYISAALLEVALDCSINDYGGIKMNRRNFMATGALAAGTISSVGCARLLGGLDVGASKKPNIVYIYTDDLGYRELGCYGQEIIQTPNIDRMCREGMKFTDHYTGAPVCAPARCNLMTGKHGGNAYIRNNYEIGEWDSFQGQLPLPADTVTVADLLKQAGYTNGAFGKWGLGGVGSAGDPLNQGFDRFFGYNCQRKAHNLYPRYLIDDSEEYVLEGNTRGLTGEHYAPQVIADKMLEWVREHGDEQFFLYYPTVLPHLPLQVPQEFIDMYAGRWEETPYQAGSYLSHPTPRAAYAAMITFLDHQVGRLMDLLKELGLDENTIVMFTSDNGTTHLGPVQVDYEFFNSVGELRGLKGRLYEGGIRVPMIARWPGRIKPGSVTDHISAQYDVLATLCDLAGVEIPDDTDGISFLPTLLSRSARQRPHEYLFWDFAGYGGQIAVRMGKWKGLKTNLNRRPNNPVELYDLHTDIGEQNDVATDHPEVVAKIEEIMLAARTKPEVERFRFGPYRE